MSRRRLTPYPYAHLLPLTLFGAVNAAVWYVWHPQVPAAFFTLPIALPFALATYRIASIIADERITEVLRAPFTDQEVGKDGEEHEVPKRDPIRNTIGSLLYCPSCVGVWTAAFLLYAYLYAPRTATVVAVIFALSALERLFHAFVTRLDPEG